MLSKRLKNCKGGLRLRSVLAVASSMILTACVQTPTTATDASCLAFGVITFSASGDSAETIRQVREHNAVWRALCEKQQ